MSLVKIDWRPGRRELRKFGVTILVGFSLIGLVMLLWSGRRLAAETCFAIAAVVGLLGLLLPRAALPVYWIWMGIGFVMGNIMGRVMLVVLYYLVFTPIGLVMRLTGRDRLRLRKRETASHWQDVAPPPTDPARYERQS